MPSSQSSCTRLGERGELGGSCRQGSGAGGTVEDGAAVVRRGSRRARRHVWLRSTSHDRYGKQVASCRNRARATRRQAPQGLTSAGITISCISCMLVFAALAVVREVGRMRLRLRARFLAAAAQAPA